MLWCDILCTKPEVEILEESISMCQISSFIAPGAGPCCFCLKKHKIHALGCTALPVSQLANFGPKSTLPGNSIDQALRRWRSGYWWMPPMRKQSMPNVNFSYCVCPPVHPKLPHFSLHPLFLPLCGCLMAMAKGIRVWRRLESFPCRQEVRSLVRVRFST